jgi:hypothetical protein
MPLIEIIPNIRVSQRSIQAVTPLISRYKKKLRDLPSLYRDFNDVTLFTFFTALCEEKKLFFFLAL